MPIPSNRTPVRVARGAAIRFTETIDGVAGAGAKALEDGEIVWDETNEKFQFKDGGSSSTTLKDHTVDTSNLAPKASPTFTGTVAIPNIANVETAITGKADLLGAAFTGDITIIDDKKLKLGTGSDLELYHDGSNSFIHDGGTGGLFIRASDQIGFRDVANSNAAFADFTSGGSVDLYHNGTKKFETTASGVTVTGAAVPASITALSYSGTSSDEIDINFNANNNFSLTTAHAATKFVVPTNAVVAGQSGSIFITQGSTTCATPIWSTQFVFSTGAAPSFTATEDKVARIDYIVQTGQAASGTEAKIHCVATDDLAATPQ